MNNFIEVALERATHYHVPNKETLKAMEEVEKYGDSLKSYPDAKSLFEDIETE